MKKQIGIIGLGKMGAGVARNLAEDGWQVIAYNRTESVTKQIENESGNITGTYSYEDLVGSLEGPRVVWVMVPARDPTKQVVAEVLPLLEKGDIIIDAANSYFKDTIEMSKTITEEGVKFVDCGVSGGPSGARNGACLMIGGEKETYEYLEELFKAVADNDAYQFFEGTGSGHFVKMVHNGIEYGMMQSIAEGFDVMKQSNFNLDLKNVARIYSKRSVIESRLIDWMLKGFETYGEDLDGVSGTASHSGEGEWTIKTAKEMGIDVDVIEDSLNTRIKSEENPSYQGKIISALRNMFGGHSVDN
jgi:6-phosphogluconate dehydrogenase